MNEEEICLGCQYENDEAGCLNNINDCRVLKRALKNFDELQEGLLKGE